MKKSKPNTSAAGAPRVAARLGSIDAAGQRLTTNHGVPVGDNQNSLKAGLRGPVLFDAVVLPAGEAGVDALAHHALTLEFISLQYRHGKTLLALGSSQLLLDKAGIAATLPWGDGDPGIVRAPRRDIEQATALFIAAVGKHRHPQREGEPARP